MPNDPSIIRAARAGLGWTQEELAAAAGIHPKSVAYWEGRPNDKRHAPEGAIPRIKEALAQGGVLIDGETLRFQPPGP